MECVLIQEGRVLAEEGLDGLPYEEEMKPTIQEHLEAVSEKFPGLRANSALFIHNDGTESNLVQLEGTIPLRYQRLRYDLPLTLWLPESYPLSAPMVFLSPTRDMIIKRPHPNVDLCGSVDVPYLQAWMHPWSSLPDLIRSLILAFEEDPPLYSRPSPVAADPITAPFSSPSESFRKSALEEIETRLKRDLDCAAEAREKDLDQLMETQALLYQRQPLIDSVLVRLREEKRNLEQKLDVILTNSFLLESWLKEQAQIKDIDHVWLPSDALSKQLLDCSSADSAIDDLIYKLDEAAQKRVVPVEVYLRQIRNLAREQFYHRAMVLKLREAEETHYRV